MTLPPARKTKESKPPADKAVHPLISALEAFDAAHRFERKILICPDINYGRELLAALARKIGGWIGWEATNLRTIAGDLALVAHQNAGITSASDIAIGALVNEALDLVVRKRGANNEFTALKESPGFRHLIRDSVLELRTAGVSPEMLRAKSAAGSSLRDLASVLETYEKLLSENKLTDSAGVFQTALDEFDNEGQYVLTGAMVIAPTLLARGLPAQLLDLIRARNATELLSAEDTSHEGCADAESDPEVLHATVPADCFAAASPSDELREVFRRISAEEIRYDDVEIVATDVDTYGVALDALCSQLSLGASMYQGVPLARTRLGRAFNRWLSWLSDGLPADTLRHALESGEIGKDPTISPAELARELRALGIGWGRKRYDRALRRLREPKYLSTLRQGDEEPDDEYQERVARRRNAAAALEKILGSILEVTPDVPERGNSEAVQTTPAVLAAATLKWLNLAPLSTAAERDAATRLKLRLDEIVKTDGAPRDFDSAIAGLHDGIGDMRAWPLMTSAGKPWASAGGMVHLTDIAHAGVTGRPRTFVVGFSAAKVSGARENPLLTDLVRTAVAPGTLVTSTERRTERDRVYVNALRSLRGRVSLSYSVSAGVDGREDGPAPLMLNAWRQVKNKASLSYKDMRDALTPPASPIVERYGGKLIGRALLDARDVWLDAITDGPLLLNGERVVRRAFPGIDNGLSALQAATERLANPYQGFLGEAGRVLDPRRRNATISPSSLETLASCPLHWFYQYGLGIRLPDDLEYDPAQWLDALGRGSLLHEVYEEFTRKFASAQGGAFPSEAVDAALAILESVVEQWKEDVPPPGDAVFATQVARLREDVRSFVEMERETWETDSGRRWREFEFAFGRGNGPVGKYVLPDGTELLLTGRIDRVDELDDGTLVIVDYKTGKKKYYERSPKVAPFGGGRRLQPAVYASALGSVKANPVSSFEYRFPSEQDPDAIVRYTAIELEDARPVIAGVLSYVERGAFLPTTESDDCKFCDYATVCRVASGEYFEITSPRASWAADHAAEIPEYHEMLGLRAKPQRRT